MPAYNVPLSTYKKLEVLIRNPSVNSVTLTVCDSAFTKEKTDYLYHLVSTSSLKGFTFTNVATPNNFEGDEYDDFKKNMKPFKKLPIMTDIKWHNQVVM